MTEKQILLKLGLDDEVVNRIGAEENPISPEEVAALVEANVIRTALDMEAEPIKELKTKINNETYLKSLKKFTNAIKRELGVDINFDELEDKLNFDITEPLRTFKTSYESKLEELKKEAKGKGGDVEKYVTQIDKLNALLAEREGELEKTRNEVQTIEQRIKAEARRKEAERQLYGTVSSLQSSGAISINPKAGRLIELEIKDRGITFEPTEDGTKFKNSDGTTLYIQNENGAKKPCETWDQLAIYMAKELGLDPAKPERKEPRKAGGVTGPQQGGRSVSQAEEFKKRLAGAK